MNRSLQALDPLSEVLQSFQKIDLDHLKKKAPLMNRRDQKFVFSRHQLPHLLAQCTSTYDILEVTAQRIIPFETIYFDTKEHLFYHDHLRGRSPRYKVRHRTYGDHETFSLEIKQKLAGNRTVKYRTIINTAPKDTLLTAHRDFLGQCPIPDPAQLLPQTTVRYQRITLLHRIKEEKITIDLNLSCKDGNTQRFFDMLVIAEIKTSGTAPSFFRQLLKKAHIHPGGISKYCLAMISLHPALKFNTFKPILKKIQKLTLHDIPASIRSIPSLERGQ